MRIALAVLACCLLLWGCRGDAPRTTFIQNGSPTETRAGILKLIPIGTPIGQADATMLSNGFSKMQDPSKWPSPKPGTAPIPGGKIADGAPDVTYWIDLPTDVLVTRTWYVQLYQVAGKVTNVRVAAGGLTGP
jgi:hypothetical protein